MIYPQNSNQASFDDPATLRDQILRLTREYSRKVHASFRPAVDQDNHCWNKGSAIPYAGRVFTENEVEAAVACTLDFWLTLGKEGEAFQNEFASFLGVRHSLLVNSGSSANLIAISVLTSSKLPEERRIQPGDEVITAANTAISTITAIINSGATPVLADINLKDYLIDINSVKKLITKKLKLLYLFICMDKLLTWTNLLRLQENTRLKL